MNQRAMDQVEPIHEHRFGVTDSSRPERDRCECGMFRYEIMGPIGRAQARLRRYRQGWAEYPR